MPVYAECAGLMYLCRDIRWQDETYEMVGAIPASVELCNKPQGHGYAQIEVIEQNPMFPVGTTFWGHEFHHSKLSGLPSYKCAYHVLHGRGIDGKIDVETDGDYWHSHPEKRAEDSIRYNDLTSKGWHILRFTSQQVREQMAEYCVEKVKDTLFITYKKWG